MFVTWLQRAMDEGSTGAGWYGETYAPEWQHPMQEVLATHIYPDLNYS